MRFFLLLLAVLPFSGCGVPTAPSAPSLVFTSVAGGQDFTCGLTDEGRAYCWGANYYAQLGRDTLTATCGDSIVRESPCALLPLSVAGDRRFAALAAGAHHACAVTEDGEAYCWGSNVHKQLGVTTPLARCTVASRQMPPLPGGECAPWPTRVFSRVPFTAIAAGLDFTCALDTDGRVWCWPIFGDGVDTASRVPVIDRFTAIHTAGHEHACGITTDHELRCWQWPSVSWEESRSPLPNVRVAAVAVAPFHACAIAADGRAFCWGSNASAQLGIGRAVAPDYANATEVVGGHRFVSLAVSARRTCGIDPAGALFCWGSVPEVLGRNLCTHSRDPYPMEWCTRRPRHVMKGWSFRAVALGSAHTCAITTAGVTYCWGTNDFGQLGDGDTRNSRVLAPVGGPAPGMAHMAAGDVIRVVTALVERAGIAIVALLLVLLRARRWIAARTAGAILRLWGFAALAVTSLAALLLLGRTGRLGGILELLVWQPLVVVAGVNLYWFAVQRRAPLQTRPAPSSADLAHARMARRWAIVGLAITGVSWLPMLYLLLAPWAFKGLRGELGLAFANMMVATGLIAIVVGAIVAGALGLYALRRSSGDVVARVMFGYGVVVVGVVAALAWLYADF